MDDIDRLQQIAGIQQNSEDPIDIVAFDIPLLIRLFEFMHETIEDDAELHEIVTNIIHVSKTKQQCEALTMLDYNNILNNPK